MKSLSTRDRRIAWCVGSGRGPPPGDRRLKLAGEPAITPTGALDPVHGPSRLPDRLLVRVADCCRCCSSSVNTRNTQKQYPIWAIVRESGKRPTLCCMVSNRTPKQRALGAALREAREAAGHTLRKFAAMIGKDPSVVSRWESGERTPQPTDVAMFLTMLGINGPRYEEILELGTDTDATSWLAVTLPEQQQHLSALLRFEREAKRVTAVSPSLVTGLLQEYLYVEAIMRGGGVPQDDVDKRVAIRLGRAKVLKHVQFTAILGEAALRWEIGGRAALIGQLKHLIDMSDQVDLRVIPFTAGWTPALEGPWTVIEFEDAPTVIHLENRRSGLYLHEAEDIAVYRESTASALDAALNAQASVAFIAGVIDELERATRDPTFELEKVQCEQ